MRTALTCCKYGDLQAVPELKRCSNQDLEPLHPANMAESLEALP